MTRARVDFAIVGGGIAGLWMHAALRQHGFSCVLIESNALGSGQTLASQGIVHGGLKYALNAKLNEASESAAAMPARWRALLADARGPTLQHGPSGLQGLPALSDAYYLFATAGLADRLVSFLASRSLQGRALRLQAHDYPGWLAEPGFSGPVYRLDDFVIDTHALLQRLADTDSISGANVGAQHPRHNQAAARLLHAHVYGIRAAATHVQLQLHMQLPPDLLRRAGHNIDVDVEVDAQRLLLCAGAGNAELLNLAQRAAPAMQLRPLHQVWLRRAPNEHNDAQRADMPSAFAHCLSGVRSNEPRLTITTHAGTTHAGTTPTGTTHPHSRGSVWSLGGALATQGVHRTRQQQIEFARAELAACVPWLPTANLQFATALIERAEPHTPTGTRPDHAYVHYDNGVFTCWPTKLTLAPDLADRVIALIQAQQLRPRADADMDSLAQCPRPALSAPAWEQLTWN